MEAAFRGHSAAQIRSVNRRSKELRRDFQQLEAINIGIDCLTKEQVQYLSSWELGT